MTMEAEELIMLKHTIENASFDILGYVENKLKKNRSMKRDKRGLQWAIENRKKAFIDGAEWQKKQTSSEQAMKYLQEHHSPSELSDFQAAMNIAVAKAIDSTINKAVEWLKGNIHYDENGDGNMEWVVMFMDDDEMVEDFKKFMED